MLISNVCHISMPDGYLWREFSGPTSWSRMLLPISLSGSPDPTAAVTKYIEGKLFFHISPNGQTFKKKMIKSFYIYPAEKAGIGIW